MTKQPKAPPHLKEPTKKWFSEVLKDFDLEPHHIRLLTLACESWDRCTAAREIIETEGLIVLDRFGQQKAHPAVAVERDSKIGFARLIRDLGLDIDAPADDYARPATIPANSHRRAI